MFSAYDFTSPGGQAAEGGAAATALLSGVRPSASSGRRARPGTQRRQTLRLRPGSRRRGYRNDAPGASPAAASRTRCAKIIDCTGPAKPLDPGRGGEQEVHSPAHQRIPDNVSRLAIRRADTFSAPLPSKLRSPHQLPDGCGGFSGAAAGRAGANRLLSGVFRPRPELLTSGLSSALDRVSHGRPTESQSLVRQP